MTESAAVATTEQPATQTAPATTTTSTESTPANAPWHSTLDPEMAQWAESKGWKKDDPNEVLLPALKSYRNSEKLISQIKGDPDRIIVMPKDMENADEVAAFKQKLGVPASIEEYEVEVTDDTPLTQVALDIAYKHNFPKEGVQTLIKEVSAKAAEIEEAREAKTKAEGEAKFNKELDETIQSLGQALEQTKMFGRAARKMFPELSTHEDAIVSQIGPKAYIELMAKIGKSMGEHESVGVGDAADNGAMSRDSAVQGIRQMQQDEAKMKALWDDSMPTHAAVKAEWDRLHNLAYN